LKQSSLELGGAENIFSDVMIKIKKKNIFGRMENKVV
jgi:hypothetical protein